MRLNRPEDPFSLIKVLAVEVGATIIFVYFVAKEVVHVIAR